MNLNFKIAIDLALTDTEVVVDGNSISRLLALLNDFEDGMWKSKTFEEFILNNIAYTALSKAEREAAIESGSYTSIRAAIERLRSFDPQKSDPGRGSEIAEICLYGIMRAHFNALPVVPKIFYKQNDNVNALGADSVHIVIDPSDDQDISLWLGETKFYKAANSKLYSDVAESVNELLGTQKIKKERQLIVNLREMDEYTDISEGSKKAIKHLLDASTSVDEVRQILNVPIMILYECADTAQVTQWSEGYLQRMINQHMKIASSQFKKIGRKSNTIHMFDAITFHLILFPVPCKSDIVESFYNKVNAFGNV